MNPRRAFLKQSLILAAGSLAATKAAHAAAAPRLRANVAAPTTHEIEGDIVVCGAGPGGIPTAIAAARNGAKVILLEQDAAIGGAPVNMYVSFLCGGPKVGIFRETIATLNEKSTSPATPPRIPRRPKPGITPRTSTKSSRKWCAPRKTSPSSPAPPSTKP